MAHVAEIQANGGYGAILLYGNHKKEIAGTKKETTNNEMELTALIEALKLLDKPCNLTIYSDSTYLVNAFENHWINNWVENGWRSTSRKPVENKDLWIKVIFYLGRHQYKFVKVKGHADNEYNNRCDKLATGKAIPNE